MVGEDQIFRDVAVWDDQAVGADGLEAAIGAGASGDPPDKNDIAIGRVLDQLGAEVGDEGEQVDDALSVLLRPANRTRRPRPVSGNARRSDCRNSDLYAFRARIGPRGLPAFDREGAAYQWLGRRPMRKACGDGCCCGADEDGATRGLVSAHDFLLAADIDDVDMR